MPYGLQKRVELARALAAEPEVLLLDEPMAGMNVEEKQDMCRFILDVNDQFGTTIVLIEHDMGVVMDISDRVVVLDNCVKDLKSGQFHAGQQVYGLKEGGVGLSEMKYTRDQVPADVMQNQDVIDAYLGTSR